MSVAVFPTPPPAAIRLQQPAAAERASWAPPQARRLRFRGLRASSSSSSSAAATEEEEEEGRSFYELLGIPAGGSSEEVKKAYRQMARKYHPDVSPPEMAKEHARRFMEVHEAYETLSDPRRRALYDRGLLQLAFSSRRRFDQELEERSEWRIRWEDQLEGLKRRSMERSTACSSHSWGARVRDRRNDVAAATGGD